ncbi:MAG: FliM/FliN family flagellar motor switch protein [Endozoicomonas sp.]
MNQEEAHTQPFNLFLAGNLVHSLSTFLTKITEKCGQKYQARLAQLLQSEISVTTHLEIEQIAMNAQTDINFFRQWFIVNDDSHSLAAVAVQKEITDVCLDILCGGTGINVSRERASDESVSSVEERFLDKLSRELFNCFEESISSASPIKLGTTTDVQSAEAERNHQSEIGFVVCIFFIIEAGDTSGSIQLLFPASTLTHIVNSEQPIERKETLNKLKHRMQEVPLPLTAILGRQQTTLRKALNLRPGDILPLHQPMDADVFISEQPFCQAQVVTSDNRLMLQISNGQSDNKANTNIKASLEPVEAESELETSSEESGEAAEDPRQRRAARRNRAENRKDAHSRRTPRAQRQTSPTE